MRLDERLSAVAALVPRGSRVADIGTDHAYLPVFLVEEGICPFAIASDVKKGPLEAAERTVKEYNLTDKISLRLGDGLASVAPHEADAVVIAGMGGETVVSILDGAGFLKDGRYTLILQPMTRAEQVRRWLTENGFSVAEEHWIRDGKHGYSVMKARYTGVKQTDELFWYAGAFSADEGREPRQKAADHLLKKAVGATATGDEKEAQHLRQLAQRLRELT